MLVGNAEMVDDDQLPDDLKPLTRWNAIRIVEDYYDQGIDKLVRSLVPELGEPASKDNAPAGRRRRSDRCAARPRRRSASRTGSARSRRCRRRCRSSPTTIEISARLKWANDQRKLSGLFTEGQELYDRGKKAAALQKFRQVRVAGGNYRGVNELMAQLEREVVERIAHAPRCAAGPSAPWPPSPACSRWSWRWS